MVTRQEARTARLRAEKKAKKMVIKIEKEDVNESIQTASCSSTNNIKIVNGAKIPTKEIKSKFIIYMFFRLYNFV